MNVQESCDVDLLLGWLLGLDRVPGSRQPDRFTGAGAREAAARLADRAHARLGAGVSPDVVNKKWKPAPPRRCWVCGCTDERACPEGCSWIAADLCSECADKALEKPYRPRVR